jgi:DNA recombination protein RmuC
MIEILLIIIAVLLLTNIYLILKTVGKDSSKPLHEIKDAINVFDNSLGKVDKSIKDDFQRNREESNKIAKENREEVSNSLKSFSSTFADNVKDFNQLQKQKFDDLALKQSELTKSTEQKLDKIRETVESKLHAIQEDNNLKLEKMRETVDEKLHKTLEHRLGESFKLVSERLEKVQKGLGEMQSLASGVGDLKKVLSNVKTRGVMGEYQLENILEQLLTTEQYAKNVKTKEDSEEFVEFAIKLPGKKDQGKVVWLPIDSKFPIENYQLLMQAYEQSDATLIEVAQKELARSIKLFAKDIREKYIEPPNTTDFAIMFLPIEGLYAEVLRDAALFETLQREFRIVITGPTTLSALLNSLQMGFRTLAIEKRSSEVWDILAAVKTEFGKFGDVLDKTKKKLQEASNVVDSAGIRSRAIERKLQSVQELPAKKAMKYLDTAEIESESHSEEDSRQKADPPTGGD